MNEKRKTMASDVFISYSHCDKAIADAVCFKLESRGIRCWYAPRDIVAGEEWALAIVAAIKSCRVMVLLYSDFSNASKQVLREVSTAVDEEIPLVPFKLSQAQPSGSMQYYLATVHWMDAIDPPLEERMDELAVMVEALLKKDTGPRPARAAQGNPVRKNVSPNARGISGKTIALLSALGVLVIAAVLWLAGIFPGSKTPPGPTVTDAPSAAAEGAEELYQKARQYSEGNGVEQSDEKAAVYYQLAADQGHAGAQARLGFLYMDGIGVEQSYEKAEKYLRSAADQGDVNGQYGLGILYANGFGVGQSYEKAAEYYRSAADRGHAYAQYSLGWFYDKGAGVEQSYEKAAEYYRLAADQGHAAAQAELGRLYADGDGVEQSFEKAAEYMQLAADQGNAYAQYNLGWLYENGAGVEQSYEKAEKYYRSAADQGLDIAVEALANLGNEE